MHKADYNVLRAASTADKRPRLRTSVGELSKQILITHEPQPI